MKIVKELLDALDALHAIEPVEGYETPYTTVYDALTISDATAAHMSVRVKMPPHQVRIFMNNLAHSGLVYSYGSLCDDNVTVYSQTQDKHLDNERIEHATRVALLSTKLTIETAEFNRKYN
jgi:hypothetical protein